MVYIKGVTKRHNKGVNVMTDEKIFIYGTFMQKQAFKNRYVTIICANMDEARQAMFAHFGDQFFTTYNEDDFAEQAERFKMKELCKIEVFNFGSSMGYELA